jgi:hypothetical protein
VTENHQESLRKILLNKLTSIPPAPWILVEKFAVGGLQEVGYATDTDLLLVLSSQGRGLFDCISGEKISRDYEEDWEGDDRIHLVSPGIGQLSDTQIRLAGLHGGGLPRVTADGWGLNCIQLPWPEHSIFLSQPWEFHKFDRWLKIASDGACEFRACGFSDTGKSFVVATSCELIIFSRQSNQIIH